MALNIKDPEADRLAREVAKQNGETITQAVITALQMRLENTRRKKDAASRRRRIMEIVDEFAKLPVYDNRSLEEMLYDENGLPK